MMPVLLPILGALPWTIPLGALARGMHSRSLDDASADSLANAPLVSVIIPARNERRNIERCARSVLASLYSALEVIVVDDHSADGTGEIARAIAEDDNRLQVVDAPPLPNGWFGKQWACATGAAHARGALLLFTDADTTHGPELLTRAVAAMRERHADLLSVAGRQEMHTFWERVIQPQLFGTLALRYGGTEHVSTTRRPEDAIANGQFILVSRDTYDRMGGHALVRDRVAEDLSIAQEWVRAGLRIALVRGEHHFATRMYASLAEIVGGWRKNIYAGGRLAMRGGRIGRALFPAALLAMPLSILIPFVVLLLGLAGVLSTAWLLWSAIVTGIWLLFWLAVYTAMEEPARYALLFPLGAAMLLYIAAGALARGQRVEWKNRAYVSS